MTSLKRRGALSDLRTAGLLCDVSVLTCSDERRTTYTHTHTSTRTVRVYSQRRDISAAGQLSDQEGGERERRPAMAEVVQEVQVLHQSEPAHQGGAGEVRQL